MKKELDMEFGNLMFGHSTMADMHELDRGIYQEAFCKFLDLAGFDFFGCWDREEVHKFVCKDGIHVGEFDNGVFTILPYVYDFDVEHTPEEEERLSLPNFSYKPNDYKMEWYKYPLRDAYANKELSLEEFVGMLNKCLDSLGVSARVGA